MGKRTLVRRRGRGGKQFRAIIVGKIAPAKYPNFKLEENHKGTVVDIVHERGRDAPLAKVSFDDGRYSYVPAPEGTIVGSTIQVGQGSPASKGNILALESVPDGTLVCNIEKNVGDGGKLIKAAGSGAIVFAHGTEGVTIKFPSG
ncbi:MAG TPA: 50S ribosomal protein L2, partial [Nitrososphaera sp.]|nr:50S ribosomal protein L2 [Nitrososphaera sp.]